MLPLAATGCPAKGRNHKQKRLPGSVPDVLQEPFGRNLAAEAGPPGEFVDPAGDREELRPLQITALRIGDLVRRTAPLDPAGGDVGERDPLVRQRVAVLAPAAPAVAVLALQRPRLIADMLGIGGKLR